jgi:hypothetical protein
VKKLFLLLVLLVTFPVFAAVPTVQVSGAITAPDGGVLGSGTVSLKLSVIGTATDAATNKLVNVQQNYVQTLGIDGVLTLDLVPNDVILPVNSYYLVKFQTARAYWEENWYVTSSKSSYTPAEVSRKSPWGAPAYNKFVRAEDSLPIDPVCASGALPAVVSNPPSFCHCVSGSWVCSQLGGIVDHHFLSDLGQDDHPQYVANSISRTITAQHTFNPGTAEAPFVLGQNAQGQLVSGFNAEFLGGQSASYFALASHRHQASDIDGTVASAVAASTATVAGGVSNAGDAIIQADSDHDGTGHIYLNSSIPSPYSTYTVPAVTELVATDTIGTEMWSGMRIFTKYAPVGTPSDYAGMYGLDVDTVANFSGTYPNLSFIAGNFNAGLNNFTSDVVSGQMSSIHGVGGAAVTYKAGSDSLTIDEITGGHFTVNNNGAGVNLTTMRAVMAKVAGSTGKTTAYADGIQVTNPALSGHTVTNYAAIHVKNQNSGTQTNADSILVDSQNYSSASKGNFRLAGGDWNTGHAQIGAAHVWAGSDGSVRIKTSTPTSATDAGLALLSSGSLLVSGTLAVDPDKDGTANYTFVTPPSACASGMEMGIDASGNTICRKHASVEEKLSLGSCAGGAYTLGEFNTGGGATFDCTEGTSYTRSVAIYPEGTAYSWITTILDPPANWDGSFVLTLRATYGATTGTVHWYESHDCIAEGDVLTRQPVGSGVGIATVPATANTLGTATISVSGLSSCAGKMFVLQIARWAAATDDTYTGTAYLAGAKIAWGVK